MATKILLKKSLTGGSVPLTSDLDQGELAVNLVDRKIYSKNGSGDIIKLDGAYVSATAPANPVAGDLWYDTTNNILKTHDGSNFNPAGYTAISDLDDVNLTSITDGELLVWDNTSSEFVNKTLSEADIQSVTGLETAVEALFSVTDVGGDGSLSYADGVFTYTGPSASEVQAHFTGGTGITRTNGEFSIDFSEFDTGNLIEDTDGTVDSGTLFFTNARARNAISSIDSGGDGALSYNPATGVITYTGPSASEVRAHFTAGTGVTVSNGQISIGQEVNTTSDVTFNEVTATTINGNGTSITLDPSGLGDDAGTVTIAGNLTVNGTTTTVSSNEVNIGDSILLLNSDIGASDAPTLNGGIEIDRGSEANVSFVWNETDDAWDLADKTLQNVTLDGGTY